MLVTGVDKPEQSRYLGDHYLGHHSIDVIRELLGKKSVRDSRTITMERPDLGLLNFIMDGPPLPGVNKHVNVKAALGQSTITGGASERGIAKKVEYVSLVIEDAPKRVSRLTRMALSVASGYGGIHLGFKYDGGLFVPDGVRHVPASLKDGVHSNEAGVTFGDPYLPHPDRDKYPSLYGDTPDPKLMDNKLFVVSNAPNLGEAYLQTTVALERATDGEQSRDYFMELIAGEQDVEIGEFQTAITLARTETPLHAARQILELATL